MSSLHISLPSSFPLLGIAREVCLDYVVRGLTVEMTGCEAHPGEDNQMSRNSVTVTPENGVICCELLVTSVGNQPVYVPSQYPGRFGGVFPQFLRSGHPVPQIAYQNSLVLPAFVFLVCIHNH
jgi:hypothetical protein